MAPRLARLKRRATKGGVPVVYVNDNASLRLPDCIVSKMVERHDCALRQIETVLKGATSESPT
jgi:hypothetical protein